VPLIALYALVVFLVPRTDYVVPPPGPPIPRPGPAEGKPTPKITLLLSGGGYRAMLFHLGALWRLNEAGLLRDIVGISSVSGGSIAATILVYKWDHLEFDDHGTAQNFAEEIVLPARRLANHTIDIPAAAVGLLPFTSASSRLISAYRSHLFGEATLRDLPDRPVLFINSTNMQSGAGWTFTKWWMGDRFVGNVRNTPVELAVAVAASSAFPPVLSPVILRIEPSFYEPPQLPFMYLSHPPYTNRVFLADGGVHDNLGFFSSSEPFDVLMVSDASSRPRPQPRISLDWFTQTLRIFDLIYEQPASSRLGKLQDQIHDKTQVAYIWSIYSRYDPAPFSRLRASPQVAQALAEVPTRLSRMSESVQKQLINFGYAVTDDRLGALEIYPHHRPEETRRLWPYAELAHGKAWPYPECDLSSPC
jgi:NTE family protein